MEEEKVVTKVTKNLTHINEIRKENIEKKINFFTHSPQEYVGSHKELFFSQEITIEKRVKKICTGTK